MPDSIDPVDSPSSALVDPVDPVDPDEIDEEEGPRAYLHRLLDVVVDGWPHVQRAVAAGSSIFRVWKMSRTPIRTLIPLRGAIPGDPNQPTTIRARPQFDFTADDLVLSWDGPADADVRILSCYFLDRVAFRTPEGVKIAMFDPQSFVRGLVRGHFCCCGGDIQIAVISAKPGTVSGAFIGTKPALIR